MDSTFRFFAVVSPNGGRVIVSQGKAGYWPAINEQGWQKLRDQQTEEENDAALAGSMFGWDCPGVLAVIPAR